MKKTLNDREKQQNKTNQTAKEKDTKITYREDNQVNYFGISAYNKY